ncbi:MAG: hypothetical protein JNL01_08765 [Bdellovibrionales bacterium]|nr:hypothetical protein [Bdellovibrionales bacterium]
MKNFLLGLGIVGLWIGAAFLGVASLGIPLLYYLAVGAFFIGVYLFLGFFPTTMTVRRKWVPVAGVIVLILGQWGKYRVMNHDLAAFFGTGSSCTHPAAFFLSFSESKKEAFQLSEDFCNLMKFREKLEKLTDFEGQAAQVIQVAQKVSAAGRMNATTATMISAIIVLNRTKQNQTAIDEAARKGIKLGMFNDLLQVVELYPVANMPTTALGSSQRELDEMNYHLNRKTVSRFVGTLKNGIAKLKKEETREPASTAKFDERILEVQRKWGITDQDVQAGMSGRSTETDL